TRDAARALDMTYAVMGGPQNNYGHGQSEWTSMAKLAIYEADTITGRRERIRQFGAHPSSAWTWYQDDVLSLRYRRQHLRRKEHLPGASPTASVFLGPTPFSVLRP